MFKNIDIRFRLSKAVFNILPYLTIQKTLGLYLKLIVTLRDKHNLIYIKTK